jgi:hypothetical protein
MLSNPNLDLDLILILSPSELHVPQSLLCLRYGKHIFIEKPLANTLKEVDQLEQARIEAGGDCIVFVGYMRRYATAVDLVKERIRDKGIKYVRVRELIGSVSSLSSSNIAPRLPFQFRLAHCPAHAQGRVSYCLDTNPISGFGCPLMASYSQYRISHPPSIDETSHDGLFD